MTRKIVQSCSNCNKYMTPRCEERKAAGRDPGPNEWCRAWKQMTIARHEQLENARLEALEVKREMARHRRED